ncbi:MAG: hypothetical protein HQ594_04715 [Candidatus Omnitrophica bacterium]|nr:hypothetical protein [Candidatus Omnitrophota bacterium]
MQKYRKCAIAVFMLALLVAAAGCTSVNEYGGVSRDDNYRPGGEYEGVGSQDSSDMAEIASGGTFGQTNY